MKEYGTQVLQKKYLVNGIRKCFNINGGNINHYNVVENQKKYGVCYCIRYRPIGMLEWILARGRWNDKGIWTADGIFNDGII